MSFGQLRNGKVLAYAAQATALVLGGFGGWVHRRHYRVVYGPEMRLLRRLCKPTLGICGGHQLLALAFGGEVDGLGRMVRGFQQIHILARDPIFDGLPDIVLMRQHHHDQVSRLPEGFDLLASSSTTRIEAMRHGASGMYGVQFHPERFDRFHPDGGTLLANFCRVSAERAGG